jgi:hypothetical protein
MSKKKKNKNKAYGVKEIKYDWEGGINKDKDKKDEVEKKKSKYPPLPNGLSSNRPH